MPPLADTQAAIAQAMVTGEPRLAPATLVGGSDAQSRFGIHLRHYHASLSTALREKFPATAWLLGAHLFQAAASAYVRERPPQTPCIAEYGRAFPSFLACFEPAARLRYVESFAALDWLLGRVSIAVDAKSLAWHDLASAGPSLLLNATFKLQPGLGYLRAGYPVDSVMQLYLSDQEPEVLEISACEASIEVSGSRGSFRITRLDPATFVFRHALSRGETVSDAAGRSLDIKGLFDPGQALRELVASGLVIALKL